MPTPKLQPNDLVFVAGGTGLVGSALLQALQARGFKNLLSPSHRELDLLDQAAVHRYFKTAQPKYAVLAAAKVGGIHANNAYPVEFLYENLVMETNFIHAAAEAGVEKLLFLGSSCIYPKLAAQPIREDSLLTGPLEPTNQWYAIAKIAGLKLCEAYQTQYKRRFVSAMPTNLYGPRDSFHPTHSHVIPGMMRRFHEAVKAKAAEVRIWGTGTVRREFLHVTDLADALLVVLQDYEGPETINIGTGQDLTIRELAELMAKVTGFTGRIATDPTQPDGTPRKILDVSKIHGLGWKAKIPLEDGLRETYRWALENGKL